MSIELKLNRLLYSLINDWESAHKLYKHYLQVAIVRDTMEAEETWEIYEK